MDKSKNSQSTRSKVTSAILSILFIPFIPSKNSTARATSPLATDRTVGHSNGHSGSFGKVAESVANPVTRIPRMNTDPQAQLAPDPVPTVAAQEDRLHKPLGTLQIWALGVGAVITGEYFGWNGGLGVAGPIGMLIATLFVCVL